MEGLIALIVIYLIMGALSRAARKLPSRPVEPPARGAQPRRTVAPPPAEPGRPAHPRWEPPGVAEVEPEGAVTSPAARHPARRGVPPRPHEGAPAVEAPRPAPGGLPVPGELLDLRAAQQGILMAEIFGPPRCRRPHRPPL